MPVVPNNSLPYSLLQNHDRQSLEHAIVYRILTDDAFVEKGLVALFSLQEPEEQLRGEAIFLNQRGFSASDASVFGLMAQRVQEGHRLFAEELAICRERSSKGMPRLGKYRGQLAEGFHGDLLPKTGANSDSVDSGAGNGVRK
jgi:hypothetical protein